MKNTRGDISYGCRQAHGYHCVKIAGKNFRVHRLVAFAFLGSPSFKASWQVNHMDGDHSNNRLDNLEWVTQSQNVRHSYAGPSRGTHGPSISKPVMFKSPGSLKWKTFPSITEAAEQLKTPYTILRRRCKSNARVNGCEFKFAEREDQTLEGEVWRQMIDPRSGEPVPGRMVSSFGRIKSKNGLVSKGCEMKAGYFRTWSNAGKYYPLVHRLVAYAFCGPPPTPKHTQVNHKDMDRGNNAVDNLEYVTQAENNAHRYANMKGSNPLSVRILSRAFGSTDEWRSHQSMTSAAQELGLHLRLVHMCVRGLRRKTGGYEFRLAEQEETVVERFPGEEWRDVDVEVLLREQEKRMKAMRRP